MLPVCISKGSRNKMICYEILKVISNWGVSISKNWWSSFSENIHSKSQNEREAERKTKATFLKVTTHFRNHSEIVCISDNFLHSIFHHQMIYRFFYSYAFLKRTINWISFENHATRTTRACYHTIQSTIFS